MSHTVKIAAMFKTQNFQSFKRAIEKFGWKLVENTTMNTYSSDPNRNTIYPIVAKNPNHGYDIGIKLNEQTEEIEVYGDFFGGSVASTLGNGLDNLKQEYTCCVAEDYFTFHGYAATREVMEDGKIAVVGEKC